MHHCTCKIQLKKVNTGQTEIKAASIKPTSVQERNIFPTIKSKAKLMLSYCAIFNNIYIYFENM